MGSDRCLCRSPPRLLPAGRSDLAAGKLPGRPVAGMVSPGTGEEGRHVKVLFMSFFGGGNDVCFGLALSRVMMFFAFIEYFFLSP